MPQTVLFNTILDRVRVRILFRIIGLYLELWCKLTQSPTHKNIKTDTLKLQMVIKSFKGIVTSHRSVASESKGFAKTMFGWADDQKREGSEDIMDVADGL